MTYIAPILLTGDQIASFMQQPTNPQNPTINQGEPGFGMVIRNAAALGGPDDVYRLVGDQLNGGTFFQNGQQWDLQKYTGTGDPAADNTADSGLWRTEPNLKKMNPKGDLVSNLGDGDGYIVFQGNGRLLIYDLAGGLSTTPTDLFYAQEDEIIPGSSVPDGRLQFADAYNSFNTICFCAGTLIATQNGPVPVDNLDIGDLVQTRDSGFQAVRWIGRSNLSLARTIIDPSILPVRIEAGAMGEALPLRDLYVSPQHRVMVRSKIVARMTGTPEALVAAKHLCAMPGIDQMTQPRAVTYLHLRLDRHELVLAEGLWAETLLLGVQALRGMGPAAREELDKIFPGLIETADTAARPVMGGKDGRQLAARHVKNRKALLSPAG